MGSPRVIPSCQASQKIVKKILTEEEKIAVSVKQNYFKKPSEIYLVVIATLGGDVYLFDLRKCPDILHQGGLWRIFKSPALLKIMHDCREVSRTLATQYGVELNNVFDTQAAYSLLLMEKGLPARLIELPYLYEKFGDAQQKFQPMLQCSTEMGGIYWAQRPMPSEMVYTVSCEALALIQSIYEIIKSEISLDLMDIFEDLCRSFTTGKFSQPSLQLQNLSNQARTPRTSRDVTSSQMELLKGSLAAGSCS